MENNILPQKDLELHEAFAIILSRGNFTEYISDIAELVYKENLNRENLRITLNEYGIKNINDLKEEILDLLIIYIKLILDDHVITEKERKNVALLKKLFKIKEGDFLKYKYPEIEEIIHAQFKRLYADNKITIEEAIYKVEFQGLFDLSYDQFDKMKEIEIQRALEEGAKITDLDTVRYPKVLNS